MRLGDKFKDFKKQAQETVAEHRDKLHEAVDVAGIAANEKTRGKPNAKIAKFGQKASDAIDKFAGSDEQSGDAGADPAGATEAEHGGEHGLLRAPRP